MPQSTPAPERWRIGDLELDAGVRQVRRGGQRLDVPGLSFDLLLVLARAAPNLVSVDGLLDTVWAGQVVNPETVAQRVKLLRAALGDDPRQPRYLALVRGRGVRLLAPVTRLDADTAAAAPVAGPVATSTVAPAIDAPARGRHRRIVALALLAGLVALVTTLALHRDPPPPAIDSEPSLAVLPFANRSDDDADAHLADGMHDELLVRLARVPGLRVISRTSVQGYRDRRVALPTIAAELAVTGVLEGAVQRDGDRVRVTVQLLDAVRDRPLWAERFERPLEVGQLLALQAEIAEAIAARLELALRPDEAARGAAGTASLAAYEAYLKGRRAMLRWSEQGLQQAVAAFTEALAHDPAFALAEVGLAETRLLQHRFHLLDPALALSLAEAGIARALARVPALPEALALRGEVLRLADDHAGAEASLRQALALNPNLADAWLSYGWLLSAQGRTAEQMQAWERAGRLDPLSPVHRTHGAFTALRAGRLAEAERMLTDVAARDPDFPPAQVILGELRAAQGDQAAAIGHYRHALALNPRLPLAHAGLVQALLDLERDDEADRAVEEARALTALPELALGLDIRRILEQRGFGPEARATAWPLVDALAKIAPARAAEFAVPLHLAEGRPAEAREWLERTEPALAEDRPGPSSCSYAHVLIASGEPQRAAAIAQARLAALQQDHGHARHRHADTVLCLLATGDVEAARALLSEGHAAGVPSGWRMLRQRPETAVLRE